MSHVSGGAYDFGSGSWPDEDDDEELVYELPLDQQIQQHTGLDSMTTSHHRIEGLPEALDAVRSRNDGYRPPPELMWYGSSVERGYRASTLRSSDYNRFASITPPSNRSSNVERINNRGIGRRQEVSPWTGEEPVSRPRPTRTQSLRTNYESTVPPNIALSSRRRESVLRPLDISMRETRRLLEDNSGNAEQDEEVVVYPPVAWGKTTLMEIVDPAGKKCAICFNEPPDDISALDSCKHTYCFECAKKWSSTRPVCPLCKGSFVRIYHDVKSNDEYKTYKVDRASDLYPNSEFRNLMYPLLHRRYIYWVTRFEHTRSRSRSIQTALPNVAGDENRSAAVLTGVSVDVLRMRRILYDREVFTDRVNGVVRDDVSGSFFANETVEVHRIFPYIRRELIFLFGFRHQNLIGPLTRAIIPLLALPGLRTDSITQQLRPILGRYTDRFLFEIVQFARTNCSLDSFESGYIYPTYMDNDWDSRISREPIIPLPADAMESRIIRTAMGQQRVKILLEVPPPLESTGEAVLNSEFVRNSERLVATEPIASRPRFNYAATRPPRIPRVLLPSQFTSTRRPSALQNLQSLRRSALAKPSTRTSSYRPPSLHHDANVYVPPTPLTHLFDNSPREGSATSARNLSSSTRRAPRLYSYSDNDECEIVDSYEIPPPLQRSQDEPIDLTCPSSSSSTKYRDGGNRLPSMPAAAVASVVIDDGPSTSALFDEDSLTVRRRKVKQESARHQQRREWDHRYSQPLLNDPMLDRREPDMVIDLTVADSATSYDSSNLPTTTVTTNDDPTSILNVVDFKPNSPPLVGESASGYTLHYSGVTSHHPVVTTTTVPLINITEQNPIDPPYLPPPPTFSPPPSSSLPLRKRKSGEVSEYTASRSSNNTTTTTADNNNDADDEPSTKRKMRRPMNPAENNALSQAFYDNLRRDHHLFSDDDDDDNDVIFNGYIRPPNQSTS